MGSMFSVMFTYFCLEFFDVPLFALCVVTRMQSSNIHVFGLEERSPCAYKDFLGKPEGTTPLGRSRRSWEDNIQLDLIEVGWGTWTGLIWLRLGRDGGFL